MKASLIFYNHLDQLIFVLNDDIDQVKEKLLKSLEFNHFLFNEKYHLPDLFLDMLQEYLDSCCFESDFDLNSDKYQKYTDLLDTLTSQEDDGMRISVELSNQNFGCGNAT